MGWLLNTKNCQCIGVYLKGRATWPLPLVFKMLLLQLFHRGPHHIQWDGCESALCRSALSNSHNVFCILEHSSAFLLSFTPGGCKSFSWQKSWVLVRTRTGVESHHVIPDFCKLSLHSFNEGKEMLLSLGCSNRNMITRFVWASYKALFRTFEETLPIEQTMLKYSCLQKVCLLSHRTLIQQENIKLL